jgi:hypothetical protein
MIIGNFKSVADRQAKLKAQAEYLQLQLENQGILEKKMNDYHNPNVPPPVPPQYKTNTELEADSIKQEKDAKDNLTSLGTNMTFSEIMTIVEDLRSRGEGALVKFNRNFPLIKKKLIEDINPKLLNPDVIITKIDEIFHKIDNSFGLNPSGYKAENIYSRSPADVIDQIPFNEQFYGEGAEGGFIETFELGIAKVRSWLQLSGADTQKLQGIMDFLLSFGANVPHLDQLQMIKTLPAVERNELTKILTKLLMEGIMPNRQLWDNLFDNIGLYMDVLQRADNDMSDYIEDNPPTFGQEGGVEGINDLMIDKRLENAVLSQGGEEEGSQFSYAPIGSVNSEPKSQRQAPTGAAEHKSSRASSTTSSNRSTRPPTLGRQETLAENQSGNLAIPPSQRPLGSVYEEIHFQSIPVRNVDATIHEAVNKLVLSLFYVEKLGSSVTDRTFQQLNDFQRKFQKIFAEANESGKRILSREYNEALELAEQNLDRDTINQLLNLKPTGITIFLRQEREKAEDIRKRINEILQRFGDITQVPIEIRHELDIIDREDAYNKYKLQVILENATLTVQQKAEAERLLREEKRTKRQNIFKQTAEALRQKVQERNQRVVDIQGYLEGRFKRFPNKELYQELGHGPYQLDGVTQADFNQKGSATKAFIQRVKATNKTPAQVLAERVIELRRDNILDNEYDPRDPAFDDKNQTAIVTKNDQVGFGAKHFKGRKIKVGKGLSVKEEKPRYREFGKYRIHNHLLDENVIHLKYPSLANIPSLKPVEVSSNYKELISGLLDTGKIDHRKLSHLTTQEDNHFRKIVKASGLSEQLEIEPVKDDKEEKDYHRLTLLKGEYEAGNNNEKLIKELRGLVVKFISLGRIPRKSGLNFLMTLSV